MKKLFKSLVVLSIASATFLASCSKEDAADVTATISADKSGSVFYNSPIKLTLELK